MTSFLPIKITAARTSRVQRDVFEVRAHAVDGLLMRLYRTVAFRTLQRRLERHVDRNRHLKPFPALSGSNLADVSLFYHIFKIVPVSDERNLCLKRG